MFKLTPKSTKGNKNNKVNKPHHHSRKPQPSKLHKQTKSHVLTTQTTPLSTKTTPTTTTTRSALITTTKSMISTTQGYNNSNNVIANTITTTHNPNTNQLTTKKQFKQSKQSFTPLSFKQLTHFSTQNQPVPPPLIRTTISDQHLYSREADKVLNAIMIRLESPDIDYKYENDLDFSGDVLNFKTHKGTWVLNKHNVTKQIWLSSPISGPSKYNYHPKGMSFLLFSFWYLLFIFLSFFSPAAFAFLTFLIHFLSPHPPFYSSHISSKFHNIHTTTYITLVYNNIPTQQHLMMI